MLTARSDGFKCRPFVLLPRKRPDSKIVEKFKNKLQLCWEGTVWMNDACTSDYLQKIIGPSFFGKRLLAWDSFRCHMSESTKKKLKELQVDVAIIPGGCTKFIQVSSHLKIVKNESLGSRCQLECSIQGQHSSIVSRLDDS